MRSELGGPGPSRPAPPPQVKVMRLALSKAGPLSTVAAPRGSLLTLPTVFETVYAGQGLRCLARIVNAPNDCTVFARLSYNKGQVSNVIGQAQGEGVLDLLMNGRLHTHGPHELTLTLTTLEGTEALRKVYKIDVNQSFVLEGAPRITFVGDKLLVRFVVRNATKDMLARLTAVEFLGDKQLLKLISGNYPNEASFDNLFMPPESVQSFVFMFALLQPPSTVPFNLGRFRIAWSLGLGEACELYFPPLRIDRLPPGQFTKHISLEDPNATRWVVGQAVPIHLAPSSLTSEEQEDVVVADDHSVLIHGPRSISAGGRAFLVPLRPGVISDVSKIYGLREKLHAYVESSADASRAECGEIPLTAARNLSASSVSTLPKEMPIVPSLEAGPITSGVAHMYINDSARLEASAFSDARPSTSTPEVSFNQPEPNPEQQNAESTNYTPGEDDEEEDELKEAATRQSLEDDRDILDELNSALNDSVGGGSLVSSTTPSAAAATADSDDLDITADLEKALADEA